MVRIDQKTQDRHTHNVDDKHDTAFMLAISDPISQPRPHVNLAYGSASPICDVCVPRLSICPLQSSP